MSSPTLTSEGGGARLEIEFSHQWFNQSGLCNEASLKTLKDGMRELPDWRNRMLPRATVLGHKLQEDRSPFVWDLALCIFLSDCWCVCFNISFVIGRSSSEKMGFQGSVSCSSKWIEPNKRASWGPLTYSQCFRSKGNNLGLWVASKVESRPVGLSPQPVQSGGIWCCLRVDSVRIALNCRTPSWCRRIAWWWGNTLPPQKVSFTSRKEGEKSLKVWDISKKIDADQNQIEANCWPPDIT